MNLDFLASLGTEKFLSSVESLLSEYASMIPMDLGAHSVLQLCLMILAVTLGSGIVFRIFFGKHCDANQAVSAAVGILFLYFLTIAVYSLNPLSLKRYLSPLPFALFRRDILIILPFSDTERTLLCSHILSLILLCFIVHTLDSILPTGKSFFMWLILRCISIVLAIFCNLAANLVLNTLLPEVLTVYAPIVVLLLLGAALIIGLFNRLLCIVFTVVNPIFGILYTFFFSSLIGKQITKAVVSTLILCLLFFTMEILGLSVIAITPNALPGYLPICGLLLFIWYFFDYKL